MKGIAQEVSTRTTRTGKTYSIVLINDEEATFWDTIVAGKLYSYDIVEKDGYRNAKNVKQLYDKRMQDQIYALSARIAELEAKQ